MKDPGSKESVRTGCLISSSCLVCKPLAPNTHIPQPLKQKWINKKETKTNQKPLLLQWSQPKLLAGVWLCILHSTPLCSPVWLSKTFLCKLGQLSLPTLVWLSPHPDLHSISTLTSVIISTSLQRDVLLLHSGGLDSKSRNLRWGGNSKIQTQMFCDVIFYVLTFFICFKTMIFSVELSNYAGVTRASVLGSSFELSCSFSS